MSAGPRGRGPQDPGRRRLALAFVSGVAVSALLVAFGYRLAALGDGSSDDAGGVVQVVTPNMPEGLVTDDEVSRASASASGRVLSESDEIEPVAAVAEALSPSVVRIDTAFGLGSGIVWDADDGYIITNQHVVTSDSSVDVQFEDGLEVEGVVVGGDPARDVAVVQVDAGSIDLVPASFAGIDTVEVGQLAVAVGHPFGLEQSVTAGVVSVADWVNRRGGSDSLVNPVPVRMIQTDAPINPGNSGGALADRHGRVIGMNTSIFTGGFSADNAGVGFAVPSDTVLLIATRIVNGESLELGYLGVEGVSLTDGTAGAIVESVVEGGPAENGGIMAGDLIVGLNGRAIISMEGLSADVKLNRPGETLLVEVLRDGDRIALSIPAGSFNS